MLVSTVYFENRHFQDLLMIVKIKQLFLKNLIWTNGFWKSEFHAIYFPPTLKSALNYIQSYSLFLFLSLNIL